MSNNLFYLSAILSNKQFIYAQSHLFTTSSNVAISDINYSLLYNDLINFECTEGGEAITQLL